MEADLLFVTESPSALNDFGKGQEEIRLTLQGSTKFAGLLPPDLAAIAAPRLDLDSVLHWSGKDQTLVLESGRFETGALRIQSEGRFGIPEQNLSAKASIESLDSAILANLAAPANFKEATLELDLEGNLERLSVSAEVAIAELAPAPDLLLGKLNGSYKTTVAPQNLTQIPLNGTTLVEGISGLPPEAERLLGQQLALNFDLDFDLADSLLSLASFQAKASGLTLDGAGSLELETRKASADLILQLPDLFPRNSAVRRVAERYLDRNARL